MRLAAGLRPDPLGELQRSPRPPSRNWKGMGKGKTVTRQRRDCDLNPGPSAPESSTQTTRLPSHREHGCHKCRAPRSEPHLLRLFCTVSLCRCRPLWIVDLVNRGTMGVNSLPMSVTHPVYRYTLNPQHCMLTSHSPGNGYKSSYLRG